MLRRLFDLPLLVILMGIAALAMYVPAVHALVLRDHDTARPFFYGATVFLALTAMIALATANRRPRDPARAQLFAMIGAYFLLPLILALPFHQALGDTSLMNAWFEMVSCLTTTGASLYETADRLPPSLHLWRAMVGWLGGLFILVAAMAILAPLNLGGVEVTSGLAPGGGRRDVRIADPSERILRQALSVLPVYGGLTLALWILLTLAGDPSFVALCHAMATLSSSAISPVGGLSGAASGFFGEVLIFLFLFFALTRRSMPGASLLNRERSLLRDPELRLAGVIVLGVGVVLMLRHAVSAYEVEADAAAAGLFRAAWGSLFTSLSFLTTTGFVSQDWAASRFWAGLDSPALILAGLAMIGGGIATTAGGVKLLRVYALFRQGERELERQVHPSSIGGAGQAARRLRRQGAYLAWIFFILFGMSIAVTSGLLAFFGEDFQRALMFSIAALSTTGPLAAHAGDMTMSYGDLSAAGKVVLAVAMIVGRIETLAILALLATDRWRH